MSGDAEREARAAKRHGVMLVVSLVLALGPLMGAIWSAIGFLLQRQEIRALHRAGKVITTEPRLEPLPITIGFVVFPVGIFLLVRATLWFSHHVRQERRHRIEQA